MSKFLVAERLDVTVSFIQAENYCT